MEKQIIHTENQLARLHATVYDYRKEARELRLSSMNPEKKETKLIHLRERIHHTLTHYDRSKQTKSSYLLLWLLPFFLVILSLIYWFHQEQKAVPSSTMRRSS